MTAEAEMAQVARHRPLRVLTLPLEMWRHPRAGDDSVVARCTGPTLDVGCGPGRIAHALATAGIPALGIDISNDAVAEARARGAAVLRRDVFEHLPGAGRWHHVLLLDGNIGIGGDPVHVLARCRASLREGGTAIAEVEAPGGLSERTWLSLVISGRTTAAVPWARVSVDAVGKLATTVGLEIKDAWISSDRSFVELRRRDGA